MKIFNRQFQSNALISHRVFFIGSALRLLLGMPSIEMIGQYSPMVSAIMLIVLGIQVELIAIAVTFFTGGYDD